MMEYNLPFSDSIEKKIVQPSGQFSHENFPESMHAIDFLLDVNTPILASRGGIVIKTKSDSDKWGLDIKLANDVNYVSIDHRDGTYAEYLHLCKDGVVIQEGQELKARELIGYSGLSGCMDEPHLHFNVFKIENGKGISIPTNLNDLVRDK